LTELLTSGPTGLRQAKLKLNYHAELTLASPLQLKPQDS
jgi:hypothetical protein